MAVSIAFNTDNDAFGEDQRAEVARMIREVAAKIEAGNESGIVRDINGNTVGQFYYRPSWHSSTR